MPRVPVNEVVVFVQAICDENDLQAMRGIFADRLQEEGDKRGPLLRQRWEDWQRERANAVNIVDEWEQFLRSQVEIQPLHGGPRTASIGPLTVTYGPDRQWHTEGDEKAVCSLRTRFDEEFRAYVRSMFPEAEQ